MHSVVHPCRAECVNQRSTRKCSTTAFRAHVFWSSPAASSRTQRSWRQQQRRPHTSVYANDRTAAPPADTVSRVKTCLRCCGLSSTVAESAVSTGQMSQTTSPDHAAVIEHSEQFLVHLKAAIADPKLKRGNEVTAEIKQLVEELKSVQPKDRKRLTKEGISGTFRGVVSDIGRMTSDGVTTLGTMSFQQFKPTEWKVKTEGTTMDIGQTSEKQYQVNIPFTFQDGPLKGEKAIQSTVGEYSLDDNEPSKQNIGITGVVLRPGSTDAAYLDKWKDIMKKENESMDDNGEVKWTAPEPMKGFRDFLYFDDQLQVSVGNLGSLTIMQK